MSAHAFDTQGRAQCPFMPVFGPPQVMFARGQGTELWDTDGKRYLDFLCGLAVTSLGHSHPGLVVRDRLREPRSEGDGGGTLGGPTKTVVGS